MNLKHNTVLFSGYGCIFNVPDNNNDCILNGAIHHDIRQDIKLLWQHDQHLPIGRVTSVTEDDIGLLVDGEILLDLEEGKKVHQLLKEKIITHLSIGYQPLDYYHDLSGHRCIKELLLFEVSVVTIAANPLAYIL